MNIGNLSEIIGAIAVVASVIYLAQQVKKQTEEARLEASRDIASNFIDTLRAVSENPEFAKILPAGVDDPGDERRHVARDHQLEEKRGAAGFDLAVGPGTARRRSGLRLQARPPADPTRTQGRGSTARPKGTATRGGFAREQPLREGAPFVRVLQVSCL